MNAATPSGSYVEGALVALFGGVLVHAGVVVIVYLLGQAGVIEDQAGWLPAILAANPGATTLLWAPLAAIALRRRPKSLQAALVCAGLVLLLNGACWGLMMTA